MGLLDKAKKIRDSYIYDVMFDYIDVEETVLEGQASVPEARDSF